MSVTVRVAVAADVAGIVRVHESAFAGFFLTQLGARFLATFYRAFVDQPDGVLLVAENATGELVGLLAGTRKPSDFFAALRRRHSAPLLMAALPGLARRPLQVAERLFAAVRYRGDRPASLPEYWLLSSLGVSRSSVGGGVGGSLVAQFCDAASDAGSPGVYLLTDRDGNEATRRFYEKCGFVIHSTHERRDGRWMLVMKRSFSR